MLEPRKVKKEKKKKQQQQTSIQVSARDEETNVQKWIFLSRAARYEASYDLYNVAKCIRVSR